MSVSRFRKKRLAIPNSSFLIPNFIRSLLVRGVDDFHKVGGLSSPQSTLRAERPDGHFLLRSLAAPLQMGPAALGSHLGGNSAADQAAVLVVAKSASGGTP